MGHMKNMKELLLKSAAHIQEYGHHQFDMWDEETKACCIMGAPRMVGAENSYAHILRDVMAHLGYDEKWNDAPDRTKEQVVDALLDCTEDITPNVLRQVYGSNWLKVLNLIRRVDFWTEASFRYIEQSGLQPLQINRTKQYTNALASFLSTVMTNPLVETDSTPYHGYFDIEWVGRYPRQAPPR